MLVICCSPLSSTSHIDNMADTQATDSNEHFSPYRPDGKLYGFVCVVTGATQPIGRAIVSELAAHGAACVYACSSTPKDDFSTLVADVGKQSADCKVIGYPLKMANEEDTLGLIDDVLNAWGRSIQTSPRHESLADSAVQTDSIYG